MDDVRLEISPKIKGDGEIKQYFPSTLTLTTERTVSPAQLTGTIPDVTDAFPRVGSFVALYTSDNKCLFKGALFRVEVDRWGVATFTAYDQLRYMKGSVTSIWVNTELCDIIQWIADRFGCITGTMEKCGWAARRFVQQETCGLDVIGNYAEMVEIYTKKIFVVYDDAGKICLREAAHVFTEAMGADSVKTTLLGEGNGVTDYSMSIDIDTDTYNWVQLFRPSSEYSGRVLAEAKDDATMEDWGSLMYFESIPEGMNDGDAQLKANALLTIKNRPLHALRFTCLGVPGLRAGMMVQLNFPSLKGVLGRLSNSEACLIDTCSHTWEQGTHIMELEVHALWDDTPKETK